jgi:hypothetical protein
MMRYFILVILMAFFSLIPNDSYALLSPLGPKPKAKENSDISLVHSTKCPEIITHFEKSLGIPKNLLQAIATVESRKSPWAVFAGGQSAFFKSKEAALKYVNLKNAQGVKVINIGCMQIDYATHKRSFGDVNKIITPYYNIQFAAKYLKRLYQIHGSWADAVRYYNSNDARFNIAYKNRVLAKWMKISGYTSHEAEQALKNMPLHDKPHSEAPKKRANIGIKLR